MTMTMQIKVQEYLNERRGLGFALTIPGTQLIAFARYPALQSSSPLIPRFPACRQAA
jgi:hypothetical protein